MSTLPPAPKDVTEHPAKGAVTEPVDRERLETDVARKLRLYGAFQAMGESRLPTNEQLDGMLSSLSSSSLAHTDTLSPDGQNLARDAHDICETLRRLVAEKNADELLQNFVWHTRDASVDRARERERAEKVPPVESERARTDGDQAVRHVRTLLSLVFTNAEVRKLASDMGVVGRDLLARGAEKVAEAARPSKERLRTVDEPGPEHRFVTEGGREVGPGETPKPEARRSSLETRALGEAQQKEQQLQADIQREGEAIGVDEPVEGEGEAQSHRERLQGKLAGMKESILGRVPEEHRNRAKEQQERITNFFRDEYFPPERRDQFVFRLKKVIYECQSHEDYKEAMTWLLNFVQEYAAHGHKIALKGKDSQKELSGQPNVQLALSEIRTLFERFANGRSLDTIGEPMRVLYKDAQADERLKHWFRDIDEFVREALLQPGYILDDQCNERARQLSDIGREFYDGKYKGHFDNLFNSVKEWFGAWAEDPLNKQIGNNFMQLAKDTLFDAEGNLTFKPELWADFRQKIIPGFIDELGYVPIPRIEYTDEQLDLVIENLALSGKNIFPNLITVETRNFAKLSALNDIKNETHHEFTLHLTQIQADMRDVAFYFHKKTGTPKITDSGVADVLLGGQGLSITAHLVSADRDRTSVFRVKDVHTSIQTLKFAIRDSKHDTLYKVLAPLATSLIKRQLQRVIANAVRTALEYVDGQLVSVRDQMAEAKASEDSSRRQVLMEQLMHRREKAQKHKKEEEEVPHKFKVSMGPGEELMPEVGHRAGWVKRAEERGASAREGEQWRSKAFNFS
ncbi:hypothetical protein LXA43DRAFT_1113109 [Ganoderma leucocontextum]|nr:hypothetical protein LXA43DRAFT_1113109 [Ganoderma leucocontextum]